MFQYMYLKLDFETEVSFKNTSRFISKCLLPSYSKYGRTFGSCVGPGIRKGSSASIVTTHGETEEQKFFPRNGPSGTYSHACISRALQSLNKTIPKIYSSAFFVVMLSPSFVSLPMMKAISNSKSNCFVGPNITCGWLLLPLPPAACSICPFGR